MTRVLQVMTVLALGVLTSAVAAQITIMPLPCGEAPFLCPPGQTPSVVISGAESFGRLAALVGLVLLFVPSNWGDSSWTELSTQSDRHHALTRTVPIPAPRLPTFRERVLTLVCFLVIALCLLATARNTVADPLKQIDVFIEDLGALTGLATVEARGITVTVHDVGALVRLERQLSEGLPANEAEAEPIARARIRALEATYEPHLIAAHQAMFTAKQFGLQSFPAIVFDRHWIAYDHTDLERALL